MTRNITLLLPNDATKTHNSRHHHQQQQQDGEEEEEEEEEERFYESLDRIASTSCSCSTSNSDSEPDPNPNPRAVPADFVRYDVWISEPASISERRQRLLRQMGLSDDPSLSRSNPRSGRKTLRRPEIGIVRSKSDGGGEDDDCCFDSCSSSVLSVYCDDDNYNNNNNNNNNNNSSSSCGSILLRDSIDVNKCNLSYDNDNGDKDADNNNGNAAVVVVDNVGRNNGVGGSGNSPSKPPLGRRMDGNHRSDSANSNGNLNVNWSSAGFMGEVVEELDCNGADGGTTAGEEMQVCIVKNLDNGKEFVVNEVREDGTWKELKEVGTGRQLTMEEFEMSVGHSPIVQELMRRQNVEDGSRENLDLITNGGIGGASSKMKKKSGWFRSIRSVASSVTGNKERRSSDERDTGSERGGRRSSSATDDSQDTSFHGPERVRVRQYGKSCKELSALFKGQEIQAHNGSIWSIKFSVDGKYLASAGEDCVIHVWQVVELERKGELLMEKPEDGNFNFLSIANGSPEPTVLSPSAESYHERKRRGRPSVSRKSSVSLDHIMVPEAVFGLTDKPICSFRGHRDDVLDLSWSKSQHLLSSSMDKTVRLWHLSSKTCLKIFSHSDYVTCIQFNPVDDNYFISGSLDAKVRIWNINERQVVDWNDLHEMVTAACYTPDGQGALVGSYKGSCRLYNTSENKLQQKSPINLQYKKKKTHLKKITGFQFAPGSSSEVLITSADSRVRVVDDGDLVHKFKGFRNTNSQISASLTANGKYVVSASEDSYVYVWKHEAESRPSRSKGVTVTRSYEHFHCQDVSVAIPWPGLADSWGLHDTFSGEQSAPDNHLDEVSIVNHPPTPVEEIGNDGSLSHSGGTNSPLNDIISSATNGYFFDRISATWPEEKLSLATRARSPHNSLDISQNMTAYGMVIVTAGLRGEIKTYQNFGLPVRI